MLIWTASPKPRGREFLFLDRDGVINRDSPEYIKRWQEFHFYPDALEALRRPHERSINVIIISNQSALNRGFTDWSDFWQIHTRMVQGIRDAGGELLAALYCPHRPDEGCFCRKPAAGLILAAAGLYGIDPANSCMIGDRRTDLLAGVQAGCRGVLLERRPPFESFPAGFDLDECRRYSSLLEAVSVLFPTDRSEVDENESSDEA